MTTPRGMDVLDHQGLNKDTAFYLRARQDTPVPHGGRTIPIAQCNNIYIFPAIGPGVVAARAQRVTDGMILAAAGALGERSPALVDPSAALLPWLADVRDVAVHVATAGAQEAQRAGVAPRTAEAELRERVIATQWTPAYPSLGTSTR
jgi:malate dehydrogenase (oxaloacetate-decarboxylating)